MRYLFIFIVSLSIQATQPEKGEQIWVNRVPGLFGIGGYYSKVDWPRPESIEDAELRIEIKRLEDSQAQESALRKTGYREMKWGVIALIAGLAAAVILAHYGFELVGICVAGAGIIGIISGAVTIKAADHVTAIAVGAIACAVIGMITFFCHGKGVKFKELWSKFKSD